MTETKLVIAGNFNQYHAWMATHQLKTREYRYIDDYEHVMGYTEGTCYLVGTYYLTEVWRQLQWRPRGFSYKREDGTEWK